MPPFFEVLLRRGGITTDELFRAFNMGVGLVIACAARDAQRVVDMLSEAGEHGVFRLGFVVAGERSVRYV